MLTTRRPSASIFSDYDQKYRTNFDLADGRRNELIFVAWKTGSVSNYEMAQLTLQETPAGCAGCHLGRRAESTKASIISTKQPTPAKPGQDLSMLTNDGVILDENAFPTDLFTPT